MPEFSGLSHHQAQQQLAKHGKNRIHQNKSIPAWRLLLSQCTSPLILILILAGLLTWFVGERIDASVIFLAVAINVALGFFQEYKAQNALEALSRVLIPKARVIRNGELIEVLAEELVPGDIVKVEAGDQVPADGQFLALQDLRVNEAVLTGESYPVVKKSSDKIFSSEMATPQDTKANYYGYMGTSCTSGTGFLSVLATGKSTQIGIIAQSLMRTHEKATPLQDKLQALSTRLLIMIGALSVIVGVIGFFSGYELVEMIKLSVSIAVSAIPEGLAITLTVILAIGMQRILKKNALVRKLVAAETLGSVNVICTDKTGTLTTGKLTMISKVAHREEIMKLAASLMQSTTDPLEIALKEWIEKQKFSTKQSLLHELPFSPDRKFSVKQTESYQIIVGAPEIILKHTNLRAREKEHDHMEVFTKKGYRLVGVAYRHHQSNTVSLSGIRHAKFTWAGFYVFSDPPRTGLKAVFEQMKKAGISVKVITGDHANTAQAILAQIGIKVKEEEIVYGHEFKTLSASQLETRVLQAKLFARTNPDQKLEIVNILQAQGKVVAMTGDGVNDAPALKQADIGIVVSGASDVSKETADMVLLDDNFATIVSAIAEGRGMFDSLQKVLIYMLSNAFTETVVVITSLLLSLPIPFTPIQILWVNLATDTLPAMALTMDQKRRGLMDQPPRSLSASLLNKSVVLFIVVAAGASSLIMNLAMIGFSKMLGTAYCQTFLFTLLSMLSLVIIFSARARWQFLHRYRHPTNWYLIGALFVGVSLQLSVIYVPFLQRIFNTSPLGWSDWGLIILLCAGLLVVIEICKLIRHLYVRGRSSFTSTTTSRTTSSNFSHSH